MDSGCRRLGVPISRRAVPPGGEGSLHLAHGASLADICRAAGWATPNTFARFYSLCVKPVSALSQSLPVCWVTVMGGKNWPVSRLLHHSPSPGDTSAFFLLKFSSPEGEPWWNPPSTPWQSDITRSDRQMGTSRLRM